MPAPYPLEQKMEILEYARDHGVNAAAAQYGVARQLITYWNKTLNVYVPQIPEYPTEKRIEIVQYCDMHGVRAAAKKYRVAVGSIDRWRRELGMYRPHVRSMTDEQKIEVLEYARDFGVGRAQDKFDVESDIINRWNKTFKIYNEQTKQYSEDFIMTVLNYAARHGVMAASTHFDINKGGITRWNATRHVFAPRVRPQTKSYTPAQQVQMLNSARELMERHPDIYPSARSAFMELSRIMDVTDGQLTGWNKKYHIVKPRPISKPQISQSQIDEIQSALNASRGSADAAARRSGVSVHLVRKLIGDKKIAFRVATDKIKTGVPVGPKKAAAINSIIQSLMNRRAQ